MLWLNRWAWEGGKRGDTFYPYTNDVHSLFCAGRDGSGAQNAALKTFVIRPQNTDIPPTSKLITRRAAEDTRSDHSLMVNVWERDF